MPVLIFVMQITAYFGLRKEFNSVEYAGDFAQKTSDVIGEATQ